jgi:hypothetical protein
MFTTMTTGCLIALICIPSIATGQAVTATWTTATANTASAGSTVRSIPAGVNIRDGQTLNAYGSPVFYTFASASTLYSVSNSRLTSTFQIQQDASAMSSSSGSIAANNSASTYVTLTSTGLAQCTLSLDYVFPAFPQPGEHGSASIDIGNDGVPDWIFVDPGISFGTLSRSTTIQFSGQIQIRINATTGAYATQRQATTSRTLRFHVTECLPAFGTASPVSVGTPQLNAIGGEPILGNTSFGLVASSVAPSSLNGLLITTRPLLPSNGLQIPDAQPGCFLLIPLEQHRFYSVLANASGNAIFSLGIPSDPLIVGLRLGAQALSLDATLPYPLPIGSTPALWFAISH